MDDLISRQAAIDALKNRWKKTRNYEGIGDDIAEECELYLKQLPSAQPEQRWIPCGKCIHADGKHRWCKVLDRTINEDYFCYWAEPFKKEGVTE